MSFLHLALVFLPGQHPAPYKGEIATQVIALGGEERDSFFAPDTFPLP